MTLSLVLPCFNEEENIETTVASALAWFERAKIDGEVIVVNDGSSDGSAKILERLSDKNPMVRIVTHEVNQGYGLAVRSGCDAASKDTIAFVDSDGQFHFEDLEKLIPHLDQYDFVPGRRRKRADSFMRNIFGKILGCLILVVFGLWIRDVNCGMKIFRADTWKKIRPLYGTEKFFNTELYLRLKKQGIMWKQIDVPHYPRAGGTPTGGSGRVIFGMIKEILDLRRKLNS